MAAFSKVLVANRGEIAIRIFRTLRELGIATVAVYSEADRASLHVSYADEAYLIGGGAPAESYLNGARIIETTRKAGAEAVHPGYGFLAENVGFARACGDAGLVWIGPPPDAMEVMSSKTRSRERMQEAGVPIIPGTTEPVSSPSRVIQRRHQKLVEETPSPVVGGDLRGRIGKIAIEAARAVGYQSAGTIEGLLSREGEYFFLEMNTRIQVEHTVTELVTGIDLVREQVLIAAGEELSVKQEDVSFVGHAIECRINAEDPVKGFLPGPGTITVYREPGGPGVRVDSGVTAGSEVLGLYDPLIAKLCVHGADREQARARMLRALEEYVIDGVPTLIGFHRALLSHPCFVAGETCEGIVESRELAERAAELTSAHSESAAAGEKLAPRTSFVELDGRRFEVKLLVPEAGHRELAIRRRERGAAAHHAAGRDAVVSPMQGTVLAVEVEEGDEVSAGQVLCIVEAMKMENEITAHREGTVMELSVSPGASVTTGQVLCVIVQDDG